MFMAQSVACWVGGKMTPTLQVTDTDIAFPLKAAANRCKESLRRELKAKAIEEGCEPRFKCGPYEILRIASEACAYVEKQDAENAIILHSLSKMFFFRMEALIEVWWLC